MAFKMKGWAASSSHIPFRKHGEPPHPDTGKVEYDDDRSSEYVMFGGVPVYGSWNEVSGVTGGKSQTIPTDIDYPVTQENKYFNQETGMENVQVLDWEEYDRMQSEGLTRENPEDEQEFPGPTREQSAGAPLRKASPMKNYKNPEEYKVFNWGNKPSNFKKKKKY